MNNYVVENLDPIWHKIQVYSSVSNMDRTFVLQTLKSSIGYAFKFASWSLITPSQVNFYVQSRQLADEIVRVPITGLTFKVVYNQNPPTARVTPELKEQLCTELSSRLSSTGHLDLCNFAETNNLLWTYWLPIHKPLIGSLINETIIKMDLYQRIISVDLSHNKLSNFNEFNFLIMGRIKILVANDNRIDLIEYLERLKPMPLTDLVIKNNLLKEATPSGDMPRPREYIIHELLRIFPLLEALDHEPILPLKRPHSVSDNYNDHHDKKIPRLTMPPINSLMREEIAPERIPRARELLSVRESKPMTMPLKTRDMESHMSMAGRERDGPIQMREREGPTNWAKTEPVRSYVGGQVDMTKVVNSIDNRLTESIAQVDKLTKLVQVLTERQARSEKTLSLLQEENLGLRFEVRRLQQQQNPDMTASSQSEQRRVVVVERREDGLDDMTQFYDRPYRRV